MELFFLEKYIWKNTTNDKKKLMFASVMETANFHSMYCLLMFLPGMDQWASEVDKIMHAFIISQIP